MAQQQQHHQQQNPQTFSIVVRYIGQRLDREGFEWEDRPAGRAVDEVDGQLRPFVDADPDIHATVRRVTSEFEQRFAEAFDELGGQLEIDRDSAYQTFQGILGATFQDGISWGRIVALMCLSGALAAKCVSLHMPELGEEGFLIWISCRDLEFSGRSNYMALCKLVPTSEVFAPLSH